MWLEEDFPWLVFRRVVFALTSQTKVQARIIHRIKASERIIKGKGKQGTFPQSVLSASEAPAEERYSHAWESEDWSSSQWTDDSGAPDAGWFCTKAQSCQPSNIRLDRDWQSEDQRSMHSSMQFCRSNKSFVFANSETGACMESCIIHFSPTPCSTKVDVLETGDVPFASSDEKCGYDY